MKRIITTMACIGLLLTTTSWDLKKRDRVEPSAKIVERTVNTKDITALSASLSVDVDYYTTSGTPKAVITAPENYQEFVKVQQKGSTLQIFYETNGHLIDNEKISIKVYGNHVNSFNVTTSADIDIKSDINETEISLQATSSGDIDAGRLKCQSLKVMATSSADINVAAATVSNTAEIMATSSADIDVDMLTCNTANLKATSSADLNIQSINATTVEANAHSSADMKLKGKAKYANLSADASGSISASGLAADSGKLWATTSGTVKSNVKNVTSLKTSTSGSVHNR